MTKSSEETTETVDYAAPICAVEPPKKLDTTQKKRSKDLLEKFVKEETKTVKGRFRCFETPGSSVRVQVKKYKDVPMFDKTMMDNEVYEIPLYVARHLNGVDVTAQAIDGKVGTCSYPVHGFHWKRDQDSPPPSTLGAEGTIVPLVGVAKRVRRFGFESLEFDVG